MLGTSAITGYMRQTWVTTFRCTLKNHFVHFLPRFIAEILDSAIKETAPKYDYFVPLVINNSFLINIK